MCHLQNIAMRDYQESVTTGQTHRQTSRQTPDKVIPMSRYASQATQKWSKVIPMCCYGVRGFFYKRKVKGRDLTQSSDKCPYTNRKFNNAKWKHKNDTKNLDYTMVVVQLRLRIVSWSKDRHPTGVFKPVLDPNLPTNCKSCVIKMTHI